MGAHSLGAAFPENSGYRGKWTGSQNHGVSEIFYSNMVHPDIEYTNLVRLDCRYNEPDF